MNINHPQKFLPKVEEKGPFNHLPLLDEWNLIFENDNLERVQKLFHILRSRQKRWVVEHCGEKKSIKIMTFVMKETTFDPSILIRILKTALIHWKSIDTLKILLRALETNLDTPRFATEMLLAAEFGRIDVLKYLIEEKGANPNICDRTRNTPLWTSSFHGKLELVQYLLENGAQIDRPNMGGETPLLAASAGGKLDVVMLLVEKGADVNRSNNYQQTPLSIARHFKFPEVEKYLISKNAVSLQLDRSSTWTCTFM